MLQLKAVRGYGSGRATNSSSLIQKPWGWGWGWAWAERAPRENLQRVDFWVPPVSLPEGLLCWDRWRAESLWQLNHGTRVWGRPLCLLGPASVLQPGGFGSSLSLCRGLQSAPNVSHYSVWKTSYSFRFFTSSYIRGNLIFHISFCFVDVIVRDAGSHATGLFWLWSAWPQLIVNGEQMKEIFTNFMGIQAGPKPILMPPFTVNVYWILWLYCALQYLYSIRF